MLRRVRLWNNSNKLLVIKRRSHVPSFAEVEAKVDELINLPSPPEWTFVSPVAQYVTQEEFSVGTKLKLAKTIFEKYFTGKKSLEDNEVLKTALDLVQQSLAISPDNREASYLQGKIYYAMEDFETAFIAYRKAHLLSLNQPDSDSQFQSETKHATGTAELKRGNTEQALQHFLKGLEIHRDRLGLLNISSALIALGRAIDAIKWLEQAVTLYPEHTDTRIQLAYLLSHFNRVSDAEEHYNKAKESDPQNYFIYLKYGDLKFEKQDFDAAKELYNTALKLNPTSSEAHIKIGQVCLIKDRNPRNALDWFSKASEIDPNDPKPYSSAALVYSSAEKYQEAISCFMKAIEIDPKSVEIRLNLAQLLSELGQYEVALNKLSEVEPRPEEKQVVELMKENLKEAIRRQQMKKDQLEETETEAKAVAAQQTNNENL